MPSWCGTRLWELAIKPQLLLLPTAPPRQIPPLELTPAPGLHTASPLSGQPVTLLTDAGESGPCEQGGGAHGYRGGGPNHFSCCSEIPQAGGLMNSRNLVLKVPEAGKSKSKCQKGLVRTCFQVPRHLSFHGVFMWLKRGGANSLGSLLQGH